MRRRGFVAEGGGTSKPRTRCGLPIRDTADCQSALLWLRLKPRYVFALKIRVLTRRVVCCSTV